MTRVTETLIDGDPARYEQRYSLNFPGMALQMVRRPVSIAPPEGAIGFLDDGPRLGSIPRTAVGFFKGGKWERVNFDATHWTEQESP